MDWTPLLAALAAGCGAGFVSGLMGVGGGIVMTPVLHYLLGYSWTVSIALSLAVIAAQAPVGIWRHQRRGAVSLTIATPLVAGGVVGVAAGAWLEPHIAVAALKVAFALLMAFAAYRLIARERPGRRSLPTWAIACVGLGAGLVSRLLGVGGGILTVPMLILGGVAPHVAVGSSLVPVFANAAFATALNVGRDLPWSTAVPLAAGALALAPLGVKAAHALPASRLASVVAVALAALAAYVLATSGIW